MDRVKGLFSFLVIAGSMLGVLRGLHVGVPLIFPETRPGPVLVNSLEEAERRLAVVPMLPAYRPAVLGERPSRMAVRFSPAPTFEIVWASGAGFLSVSQQRGGRAPGHPPFARAFEDVPDSLWWIDEARPQLILRRGDFWFTIETSLSTSELRRFADTLAAYR
jgi:hypothetical protein